MPTSQDMVIFVLTTITTTRPITLPFAHARSGTGFQGWMDPVCLWMLAWWRLYYWLYHGQQWQREATPLLYLASSMHPFMQTPFLDCWTLIHWQQNISCLHVLVCNNCIIFTCALVCYSFVYYIKWFVKFKNNIHLFRVSWTLYFTYMEPLGRSYKDIVTPFQSGQ